MPLTPVRWLRDIASLAASSGPHPTPAMLALAGGKGANLAELLAAGLPVPSAFVVTAETHRAFLETGGLRATIAAALKGVELQRNAAAQAASRVIQAAIEKTAIPAELTNAITIAYHDLGGYVAVRSSGLAEDATNASFAGQQATFLNILGSDELVAAVRRCWAGAFEAQAISYRARHGLDPLAVEMAVIVQQMLEPEVAGVIFTIDPVTNDPSKLHIETVYGLGEGLVSGELAPDIYTVEKDSLTLLESTVAHQQWRLVRNPDAAARRQVPNRREDLPVELRERAKLDTPTLHDLAAMAVRLEQHYGHPQDIEWALQGGELYLLQSRPVTTLGS